MSQKTYVLVAGYARSGKTTLLNSQEYPVVSSSQILKTFCAKLILATDPANTLSEAALVQSLSDKSYPLARDFQIAVAEDCLVPVFGRSVFSATVAKAATDLNSKVVLIETIGGQEALEIALELPDDSYVYCINIRHADEQPGADIRELLGTGATKPLASCCVNFWVRHDYSDRGRFTDLISGL